MHSAGLELTKLTYIWANMMKVKNGDGRKKKSKLKTVASVAYQVILEPGIGQVREFKPRRVHTRVNPWGLFLVHKLTCGKRESVI